MVLKSSLILTLFYLNCFAAGLPQLSTKQKLANIRFLSKDNRHTYYQNQSGKLQLATNFSAHVVLSKSPDTEYFMHGSAEEKKIMVEIHQSFFEKSTMLPEVEFGFLDYGGHKYTKLGVGTDPKFHLKGEWFSYYKPGQKMLFFKSLASAQLGFQVELKNPISPFFIPERIMINTREVLFTDFNNRGETGILYFDRGQNTISPVYKSTIAGAKIEICELKNKVVIGEFSKTSLNKFSKIISAEWSPNTLLKETKQHYRSGQNDIGKITCHTPSNTVFFIKNLSGIEDTILEKSELVQLNLSTNRSRIISNLKNVSHLVNMDSRIIIPYRGKIFVAHGKSDAFSDKLEPIKK